MGWSRGAELLQEVWKICEPLMSHSYDVEHAVARDLVKLFESYDCDTIDETDPGQIVYGEPD